MYSDHFYPGRHIHYVVYLEENTFTVWWFHGGARIQFEGTLTPFSFELLKHFYIDIIHVGRVDIAKQNIKIWVPG